MPAIPVKQMLSTLLKAPIELKDKQAFEGMWDAIHRYGSLSKKQVAWIEDAYYKLPKAKVGGRSAAFASSDVSKDTKVRDFKQFEKTCPSATSSELARVKKFFESGGVLVTVNPKS